MNILLVHGSYGKPFENWFPWLEDELAKKSISCIIPSFPTPEHQNYNDWSKLLDYYRDMGIINEETILIGHSCGAICVTRYICDNDIKVKSLITVSGYNNYIGNDAHIDNLNSSFYCDNEKLKKVKNLVTARVSFISNNDPFISNEALISFSKTIDSQLVIVKDAGHFNEKAGYIKFTQILEYLNSLNN